MRNKYLTAAALITAIALALLTVAGCTSFGASTGSGGQLTPKPASDQSSLQPGKPDGSPSEPSAGPTPATPDRQLSIAIPSGIVLQHGELAVNGSGFQPGEEVALSARMSDSRSTTLIARITADDQGTLSDGISVAVPDWLTSGIYTLIATGEKSGLEIETPLYVRADKVWLEIGNYGVRPTDRLGFVAGGFEPAETISVFLQGLTDSPLTQVVADRAGNIPWTEVEVPVLTGGDKTLTLRGDSSKEEASAVISVVPLTPWIELVPYAGRPGSQVKLHGRGFVPGETIQVTFGQFQDLTSTFVADEYGNFFDQALTTIPMDARGGPLEVKAIGETSNVSVAQSFNVLSLEPWVGLDNYAGPPGTTVRFRGLGFAAGERITIRVSDRSSSPVASGQADEDGSFGWIGQVTVPADTTQDLTFYATGESSHAQASVTFKPIIIVIPTPVLPPPPEPIPAR